MTWQDTRAMLLDNSFSVDGQVFSWDRDDAKANELIAAAGFDWLGAGTNKIAVRVAGTPWVLLFGKNSGQVVKHTFKEEVETLRALGIRGLRVPAPFTAGAQAVYLFNIVLTFDGEQPTVPAFLQGYMSSDQYVEMKKKTPKQRDDFARTAIVIGGRVPATIGATLADLTLIREQFHASPWGDFQVMYNKFTGELTVFDPLPNDPNAEAYLHSIDTWLKDIQAAIAIRDVGRNIRQQIANGTS